MKGFLLCLLVFSLLPGCGAEGGEPDGGFESDGAMYPPDFWNPGEKPGWDCSYGYGESCPEPAIDCDRDPCVHGRCLDTPDGADSCLCDLGYAGLLCDLCAQGYHAEGLGCVRSDPCAASPCVYGTCRVRDDDYACDCYEGYAGRNCDECADGYHPEDLECVPD